MKLKQNTRHDSISRSIFSITDHFLWLKYCWLFHEETNGTEFTCFTSSNLCKLWTHAILLSKAKYDDLNRCAEEAWIYGHKNYLKGFSTVVNTFFLLFKTCTYTKNKQYKRVLGNLFYLERNIQLYMLRKEMVHSDTQWARNDCDVILIKS